MRQFSYPSQIITQGKTSERDHIVSFKQKNNYISFFSLFPLIYNVYPCSFVTILAMVMGL